MRPTTPDAPQSVDPGAAIPSYGSAPPPSVVATLKSISEFTIVEPAEESTDAPTPRGISPYEPPTVRAGAATVPDDAPVVAELPATTLRESDWRTSGADASASETLSDADRLFDAPEAADSADLIASVESAANDDVIATAFGAANPLAGGSREPEDEEPPAAPTYIGGDPSTLFAAESLEEVARGIRAGEIVLPPIDPAADQSAVLAAVLAALLAPHR